MFTYFTDCSNTELPPFFGGETEAGQRQCAMDLLRETGVFEAILVSIDGRPPVDIYSDRYLAVSPQTMADLPDPNILSVPADAPETTFVAGAWVAMIRRLPSVTHTVRVEIVAPDGTSSISQAIVKVMPRKAAVTCARSRRRG
jgi:hypothetical protein